MIASYNEYFTLKEKMTEELNESVDSITESNSSIVENTNPDIKQSASTPNQSDQAIVQPTTIQNQQESLTNQSTPVSQPYSNFTPLPDHEPNPVYDPDNTRIPMEPGPVTSISGKNKSCPGIIHVVKAGDTLYKIANKHKMKVLDILLANPFVNVYNLQPGDEICIPVKAIQVTDQPLVYIVQSEDTIQKILKKSGIDLTTLFHYNPFLFELPVKEGNVIFLPNKINSNSRK